MKVFLALLVCVMSTTYGYAQQDRPGDAAPRKGIFTGQLQLSPTGDGVNMKVLQPISYDDSAGHMISVPAEFETDGASIPRALWSIVGSPFSGGNYVQAAVIHDEGCVSRQYPWEITHMMFYTAMLDSGVSEHQAKLLYFGVRVGGPRWKKVKVPLPHGVHGSKCAGYGAYRRWRHPSRRGTR